MTAVPANPRVSELRSLFRHYLQFRATFEETGLEIITAPDGKEWSIWDLDYLRSQFSRLTLRQQQAINLCLIHNMREKDAAVAMGVGATNPVSMYATLGLQRLLDMVDAGELRRFREQRISGEEQQDRHDDSVKNLVSYIEKQITEVSTGCWLYPNRSPKPPRMLIRSPRASSGFLSVSPAEILWRHYIGALPDGATLEHRSDIVAFSISCVNPHHGQVAFSVAYRDRVQVLASRYKAGKGQP